MVLKISLSAPRRSEENDTLLPPISDDLKYYDTTKSSHQQRRYRWLILLLIIAATHISIYRLHGDGAQKKSHNVFTGTPPPLHQCKSSSSTKHKSTVESMASFSSYLSNSHPSNPKSILVSYDERSIRINNEPTVLLSGSIHPVRATSSTWDRVLDNAVQANLNMVTIYLMWGYHQTTPHEDIDWTLPGGGWDLSSAIWEAACRGLYVHIRIGPYVCAEYTYGGIPEWVPLVFGGDTEDTKMSMRRPNVSWMEAMKVWVDASLSYLERNGLFAHQGGPIILAQIENELGGNVDPDTDNLIPNQTLQDYADWCGDVAIQAQPDVIWTMCNGLSSNRTINTCNGYGEGGACSTSWLEQHGQSGRVQIDHPALWTESEMGFQIWGDDPTDPSDYFWGRTARDVAGDILRWFARGGTHVNTYMFWGGYNRGRMAAGGIMNAYATDAFTCPNGEKRQPKFDHITEMHRAIANIAQVLVNAPTALGKEIRLEYRLTNNEGSQWQRGTEQLAFQYESDTDNTSVLFVENNSPSEVEVRISSNSTTYLMKTWSSLVIVDDKIFFSSAQVNNKALSYRRETIELNPLNDWKMWVEPRGANSVTAISDSRPWEQTRLLLASNSSTDYIWYETSISFHNKINYTGDVSLIIETQKATAMTAFLDDRYIGTGDNHEHKEGNNTLKINFPGSNLHKGGRTLQILSENFGYGNLIGRWGVSSDAKSKGITGKVWLEWIEEGVNKYRRQCLTCGNNRWKSHAGLQGHALIGEHHQMEANVAVTRSGRQDTDRASDVLSLPCTWSSVNFRTPPFDSSGDQELMLKINVGRGEIWLNDVSLGRFWNITRRPPSSPKLSQEYYHLPRDLLKHDKQVNRLVFFNVMGGDISKETSLVLTRIEPSDRPNFYDEVDFPAACL